MASRVAWVAITRGRVTPWLSITWRYSRQISRLVAIASGASLPAGVEPLAEPAEPAQIDDRMQGLVDDQQEEGVRADIDHRGVHRPSRLAMMTFMISLVPAKIRCTRASMYARVTGYSSM